MGQTSDQDQSYCVHFLSAPCVLITNRMAVVLSAVDFHFVNNTQHASLKAHDSPIYDIFIFSYNQRLYESKRCCPPNRLGGILRLTPLPKTARRPGLLAGDPSSRRATEIPLRRSTAGRATRMLLGRQWRRPDGQITGKRPGAVFRWRPVDAAALVSAG